MATADSISISDRMSSSSSLFVPPRLKTTTISTIAVQCFESRMVIALLQSKDVLNLRILEMKPSLTSLGKDVEESERLLNEHMKILDKLRNNQTPLEEYFRRTNSLSPNTTPELFTSMGDNLGQAWRDLLANLELRKEILKLGIIFHGHRIECVQNFKSQNSDTGKDFMQKYSNVLEAGRKLLEKLEIVEDSWESVARVNGWLQDLASKLQESKIAEKKRDEEDKMNKIFEELKAELDDIIASPNFESKTQRLVVLLAKVNSNASMLHPDKKSELESAIYSLMEELAVKNEISSELNDFLNQNKQLHAKDFKEKYYEKLKMARNLDSEITSIIQNRLAIREDYEEILQNVLGYSEVEIVQKLSRDKDLETSAAFENIRLERLKQGTELFDLFSEEIQNLESQAIRNGDLERILSGVSNLIPQLENAPEFLNKDELIRRCAKLQEETLQKIQIVENISKFVNNYRDLTEEHFLTEHNTILHELEKINRVDSNVWRLIKNRISVRRSYEDILRNPTQFEEDEIIELLTREDSLDTNSAFKNIRNEKRLQELLQTLDFPLPENLETARNDLEDFKSFEQITQSLPNATEELIEKTVVKKTKILKCIEFYELVESIERTKNIKHISRLEIELFGTTHISESIYEEKINQMEQLRQLEIAESQKFDKRKISNIEVQTDDELFPVMQERPITPPRLLVETDTQTKETDPLELRNSETQTTKIASRFSSTQTSIEQNSDPIQASSTETQTAEIQPQIIYLYPEPAPVKLRNSQTQTVEEATTDLIQKRSQMLIEETFEEFEPKRIPESRQKFATSNIYTQTDKGRVELPEEILDDDTLLVKTSDVASIAKLLLNTECQTESEKVDRTLQKVPLDIVIPTDFSLGSAPPVQDPKFSTFLLTPAMEKQKTFQQNTIEYNQRGYQDIQSVQKISTTIDRRFDEEETKIELTTPQMTVRDRVKAWQVTSPDEPHNKRDKIWQNNNKLKSQISRHLSLLEEKRNMGYDSAESDGNYRLSFQSPVVDRRQETSKPDIHEKETKSEKYERKRSVTEYRKMFQNFAESGKSDRYEKEISNRDVMFSKSHIKYKNPEALEEAASDEIPTENGYRVTEAAREKTLAMYRKLTQYNSNEDSQQSQRFEQTIFEKQTVPSFATSQPSIPTMDDKYLGFARSEESLDGMYLSSSSEISHRGFPHTNKYNTLPIRPSKFVPKEFQESDYESDYDCKIPPIWVPPSGKSTYSTRGNAYRPIPSDYRSKSVPPSDINGNESSNIYSKQAAVSHLKSTIPTFKTPIPKQRSYSETWQQYPRVPVKPIPPPKPSSRKTSPAFQMSKEIVTTKREATLKSELTERKETKFILAPPKELQEGLEDLTVRKMQPAYYVSLTSPAIIVPKPTEEIVTKSYESREERFEKHVEEFITEPRPGPSYNFNENQMNGKSFPTITTFARQKELMHPILYELDDQNERIEVEEIPFRIHQSDDQTRVIGENQHRLNYSLPIIHQVVEFSDSEATKSTEIIRFTPSKFIPMMTSEEEFSSAAEEDFIVEPKWKPLDAKRKPESVKYGSVKGPHGKKEEKQTDPPVFYIACDFSCEYGLVGSKK